MIEKSIDLVTDTYYRPGQISQSDQFSPDGSTSVSATVSGIVCDLLRTMPLGPKLRNRSDDAEDDNDHLALRLIELLNDELVLLKLKTILFPKSLTDMMNSLNVHIQTLNKQLGEKEARIKCLETKVDALEGESDRVEQYSRRANVHFCGIPEGGDTENTDDKVLSIINNVMGMNPPVERCQLERTHRLGRKTDGPGRQRARPIIVRFTTEKRRDDVYRARTRLKGYNHEHKDQQIYVNEDLTSRRSKLAYETRQLKSSKKITDCWTYNGKVLVKDLSNQIKEITCPRDLLNI